MTRSVSLQFGTYSWSHRAHNRIIGVSGRTEWTKYGPRTNGRSRGQLWSSCHSPSRAGHLGLRPRLQAIATDHRKPAGSDGSGLWFALLSKRESHSKPGLELNGVIVVCLLGSGRLDASHEGFEPSVNIGSAPRPSRECGRRVFVRWQRADTTS